ncbi:MAG: DNA primase [bacterium]|nr:DNA primase [bacterium]
MEKFTQEFIDRVRDAVDIVEIISEYVTLKPAGRNHKGLCPFHSEKTPSFMVHREKQIFHCFGCGVGGNVFTFLQKQNNLTFNQAVRFLAERAGIPVVTQKVSEEEDKAAKDKEAIYTLNKLAMEYYHRVLFSPQGESARKYLIESRNLTVETIKNFKLGYALPGWDNLITAATKKKYSTAILEKAGLIIPREATADTRGYYDRFRDQIIFPIMDAQERVIGFGGRVLDNRLPKYLNSPETVVFRKSYCLYGLPLAMQAIRESGYAILVEGYMDCIRAHQAGITHTIATLGTSLTTDQARLLRRYTQEVVLVYDTDPAGIAASLRGLEQLISVGLGVKVVALPVGKDPDEFIANQGKEKFLELIHQAKRPISFAIEVAIQQYGIKTIDAQVQVVNSILPLIVRIPQPVEQDLYLKQLAESVRLDILAVKTQFNRIKRGKTAIVEQSGQDKTILDLARESSYRVEKDILALLLEKPDLIAIAKEQLTPQDFIRPEYQAIVAILLNFPDGKPDKLALGQYLLTALPEEPYPQLISELELQEVNYPDVNIALSDFIKKILLRKRKMQLKELQENLKQAELAGNMEQVKQLQSEIIEISSTIMNLIH